MSDLGEAALEYAERGWYIFPIVPGRKAPALFKNYYELSSKDSDQIRAWWREVPDANIGLDCGKSQIVAIDVDSAEGHGAHVGMGPNLLGLQLLTGGKSSWNTLSSSTPTGGRHYFFSATDHTGSNGVAESSDQSETLVPGTDQSSSGSIPKDRVQDDLRGVELRGGNSKEASILPKTGSSSFGSPGIDVRSVGGYVVLPPSSIGGSKYTWVRYKSPVLPLPTRLLSTAESNGKATLQEYRDESGRTELESRLDSNERIVHGTRDNFLYAIACKLVDQGFGENEIRALIRQSYIDRCDTTDPLDEKDFQRIAESSMRHKDNAKSDVPNKIATAIATPGHWNTSDETHAIPASDFIQSETATTDWLIDGLFQRSSVNMFMGPPKGGKSTLLRHLALCTAYGLPFLGRFDTKQAPVLYYSLQENKPHLRRWLLEAMAGEKLCKLGETPPGIPIDFIFQLGHRGKKAIKGTLQRIKERDYGLVIIDMWGRYSGVASFDDYAENEAITDALNQTAQETNACVIWSHHERKNNGGSDSFAGAIGSQAIRGAVYTTLKAWKDRGRYYISTEQRDGDDLYPVAVTLEKKTQIMRCVGSLVGMSLADALEREAKIEALLEKDPNIGIKEIIEAVGGTVKEVTSLVEKLKDG